MRWSEAGWAISARFIVYPIDHKYCIGKARDESAKERIFVRDRVNKRKKKRERARERCRAYSVYED